MCGIIVFIIGVMGSWKKIECKGHEGIDPVVLKVEFNGIEEARAIKFSSLVITFVIIIISSY